MGRDRVDSRVRVDCARCGTVEASAASVVLLVPAPHDTSAVTHAELSCPTCGSLVRLDLDDRAARLLLVAGCATAVADAPPVDSGPRSQRPE